MRSFAPLGLVVFLILLFRAPLAHAFQDARDRFNDVIQRLDEGSLDELVATLESAAREQDFPVAGRVDLLTLSASIVELVALGDKSPLKGRISTTQWDFLKQRLPLLKRGVAMLHRSIYQSAFEGIRGGDLEPSKVLVEFATVAMRELPHRDLLAYALRSFTASRAIGLACEGSLLGALLERSERPDLDPRAREEAQRLHALHLTTRTTAQEHHQRLMEALGVRETKESH